MCFIVFTVINQLQAITRILKLQSTASHITQPKVENNFMLIVLKRLLEVFIQMIASDKFALIVCHYCTERFKDNDIVCAISEKNLLQRYRML